LPPTESLEIVVESLTLGAGTESETTWVNCLYLSSSSEVGIPKVERSQSHPVSMKTSDIAKESEIILFIIF
jgi:hypothetical protein